MMAPERVMLIAPRFDYALHAWLEKKFELDPEVIVVRDRRSGQRRRQREMRYQDRRNTDRRGLAAHRAGILVPITIPASLGISTQARLGTP